MNESNTNQNTYKNSKVKDELEKYLEQYYGKSISEIGFVNKGDTEVDWGKPVGEEIW